MKKGVALLWVLVVSAVLLTVSGTMVTYIIKDSQSTVRIEDSARAYAAAKSGLDWGKLYYESSASKATLNGRSFDFLLNDGGTQNIRVTVNFTVTGATKQVTSEADSNTVLRKLEYNFINKNLTPITGNSPVPLAATNGDFDLSFDFWCNVTGTGTCTVPSQIGLQNAAGSGVFMQILADGKIQLFAKDASVIPRTQSDYANKIISTNIIDRPFRYRAVISYTKNIEATLTISERSFNASNEEVYTNVGKARITLTNASSFGPMPSNFDTFSINPSVYVALGGIAGDGEYYQVTKTGLYYDKIMLSR